MCSIVVSIKVDVYVHLCSFLVSLVCLNYVFRITIVVSILCSSVAEVYYRFSPADTPGAIIPIRIERDYFRHVLLCRLQNLHPPPSL